MGKKVFGTTPSGDTVYLYSMKNAHGVEALISNFGGTLLSLSVPDRKGKMTDIVLGYDSLAQYLQDRSYFGCLVGRYANRIGKARFTLDGSTYVLAVNNGSNHLHGGIRGFDKVVWTVDEKESTPGSSLVLRYRSPDGEEGYPGNLSVRASYTLTDKNELVIDYSATTDKPTVVNLTHHSYFNLGGAGRGDILGHELMIDANKYTPVDSGLISTGEARSVEGTPMDFRSPTEIGKQIIENDIQLRLGGGYDHNWVLNGEMGTLRKVASAYEPSSGRLMEVLTTEPGLQFYSGNFLDGSSIGKGDIPYHHRFGFCLETQHFPDSPNKPEFPTTVLRPGETYSSKTVYRFSVRN